MEEGHLMQPPEFVAKASIPKAFGDQIKNPSQNMLPEQIGKAPIIICKNIPIITVVSAEKLVASVSSQNHFHMLSGQLRNIIHADRERIGRLVKVPHQIREQAEQRGMNA